MSLRDTKCVGRHAICPARKNTLSAGRDMCLRHVQGTHLSGMRYHFAMLCVRAQRAPTKNCSPDPHPALQQSAPQIRRRLRGVRGGSAREGMRGNRNPLRPPSQRAPECQFEEKTMVRAGASPPREAAHFCATIKKATMRRFFPHLPLHPVHPRLWTRPDPVRCGFGRPSA